MRVNKVYAFVRLRPPRLRTPRASPASVSPDPSPPLPRPAPSLSSQNGFGDVAYIGWVPLDLYRASGAKMRSEKEAHRDWPVPRQPEEAGVAALFGERVGVSEEVAEDEEGKTKKEGRFRIQW